MAAYPKALRNTVPAGTGERPRPSGVALRVYRLIGLAGLSLSVLGLAACAGGPREFAISGEPYQGPAMSIRDAAGQHLVVMQAPSGGWSATLDATRKQFEHTEIFITVVRPNPAFIYTQALVDQAVATEVEKQVPIRVFARILGSDEKPASQPYSRAARSDQAPPAAAPAADQTGTR